MKENVVTYWTDERKKTKKNPMKENNNVNYMWAGFEK